MNLLKKVKYFGFTLGFTIFLGFNSSVQGFDGKAAITSINEVIKIVDEQKGALTATDYSTIKNSYVTIRDSYKNFIWVVLARQEEENIRHAGFVGSPHTIGIGKDTYSDIGLIFNPEQRYEIGQILPIIRDKLITVTKIFTSQVVSRYPHLKIIKKHVDTFTTALLD